MLLYCLQLSIDHQGGVTRDAVEEHGGEPLLEYDGDPLDQVVDHLLFVYFKFDDCDKDFKSES